MAIQPIDLQTMYSQMQHIANKVSAEQHGLQNSAALQQQAATVQNQEQLKTVKKAADNESKAGLIKEDGHQNQENLNNSGSKKESQDKEEAPVKTEIREDYLGQHINITR